MSLTLHHADHSRRNILAYLHLHFPDLEVVLLNLNRNIGLSSNCLVDLDIYKFDVKWRMRIRSQDT